MKNTLRFITLVAVVAIVQPYPAWATSAVGASATNTTNGGAVATQTTTGIGITNTSVPEKQHDEPISASPRENLPDDTKAVLRDHAVPGPTPFPTSEDDDADSGKD